MPKFHKRNGFIYFCEKFNFSGSWVHYWSFKPVGAQIDVKLTADHKILKADMEALLDNPSKARAYYNSAVTKLADISAAEAALLDAIARHSRMDSPTFDPGGRRSNPGAVSRALRERAGSRDAITRAENDLIETRKKAQILAEGNRAHP